MGNYAYVSLLTSDNYLKGILGLKYSMEQVNSKYPLLVICTDNLSEDTLNVLKSNSINFIIYPLLLFKKQTQWSTCINKFYAYKLIQYEKIIFVDADLIFLENMDRYFYYNVTTGSEYFNGTETILTGGFILILPSENLYQQAMNFIKANIEMLCDDEQVFTYLFTIQKHLIISQPNYFHDGTLKKYWENYTNFTDIQNFILKLQDKNNDLFKL